MKSSRGSRRSATNNPVPNGAGPRILSLPCFLPLVLEIAGQWEMASFGSASLQVHFGLARRIWGYCEYIIDAATDVGLSAGEEDEAAGVAR